MGRSAGTSGAMRRTESISDGVIEEASLCIFCHGENRDPFSHICGEPDHPSHPSAPSVLGVDGPTQNQVDDERQEVVLLLLQPGEIETLPPRNLNLNQDNQEQPGQQLIIQQDQQQQQPIIQQEQGVFICDVCGKNFTLLQNLRRHTYSSHTDEKKYACDFCGKLFKWAGGLNYHVDSEHSLKEYICICGKKFKNKVTLIRHSNKPDACQKNKSRPKSLKCDTCGKVLTTIGNLKRHVNLKTCKAKE